MASRSRDPQAVVIGYLLAGHDNRAHFFEVPPPDGVLCSQCNSVLDDTYRPASIDLRTRLDVSSTYDNVTVVSDRFVRACEELMLPGIEFHRFHGKDTDYFFAEAHRRLPFDTERRNTRFEGKCHYCGNFESVVGITPAYMSISKPIARGFFRTDVKFGSGNAKRPALIVDLETAVVLLQHRFKGLDLHEIEGTRDAI